MKIVITADQPLGHPDLGEQYFPMGPLNVENTKLFAHIASPIHRLADCRAKKKGGFYSGLTILIE